MQKIVRIEFRIANDSRLFLFDKQYDPKQDDQHNCDNHAKTLITSCENKATLAVMIKDSKGDFKPAVLNLGLIPMLEIDTMGVFIMGKKDEENAAKA